MERPLKRAVFLFKGSLPIIQEQNLFVQSYKNKESSHEKDRLHIKNTLHYIKKLVNQ